MSNGLVVLVACIAGLLGTLLSEWLSEKEKGE